MIEIGKEIVTEDVIGIEREKETEKGIEKETENEEKENGIESAMVEIEEIVRLMTALRYE